MDRPWKWEPSNEDGTAGSIIVVLPIGTHLMSGRREKLTELIQSECGSLGVNALLEAYRIQDEAQESE